MLGIPSDLAPATPPRRDQYPTPPLTVAPPDLKSGTSGLEGPWYPTGHLQFPCNERHGNKAEETKSTYPEYLDTLRDAINDIEPPRSVLMTSTPLRGPARSPNGLKLGEPLFLPDGDEAGPSFPNLRRVEEDQREVEEDEIVCTGSAPSLALVMMGDGTGHRTERESDTSMGVLTRIRKRNRAEVELDVEEVEGEQDDFEVTGQIIRTKYARQRTYSPEGGTPLRECSEMPNDNGNDNGPDVGCQACGCTCRLVTGRGSGSGSQVLTLSQRANLLRLLLGDGLSFHQQLVRLGAHFNHWADVAVHIGATARDFDRVRAAAKWMQHQLPLMMRGGRL